MRLRRWEVAWQGRMQNGYVLVAGEPHRERFFTRRGAERRVAQLAGVHQEGSVGEWVVLPAPGPVTP